MGVDCLVVHYPGSGPGHVFAYEIAVMTIVKLRATSHSRAGNG